MTIKILRTKNTNKRLPVLLDNNNNIIQEVFRYLKNLIINNYSENTVELYCYYLKSYYEWLSFVGLDYHSAVAKRSDSNKGLVENLTNYKLWLKYGDRKITPIDGVKQIRETSTVNNMIECVLGFYDFLVLDEGIEELQAYYTRRCNTRFGGFLNEMTIKHESHIKVSSLKEKATKKGLRYIERADYEKIYELTTNQRDKVLVGLLFEAGLRLSEAIGLTIDDFKFIAQREILIRNHHDPNNRDAALKNNSTGICIIPEGLQEEIIKYINEVVAVTDTNYFLFNLYGDTKNMPMRRSNIESLIKRLGKKIGIDNLHPHMFRHGLAVDMLQNGCPMEQIKDALRHKNIDTTANIYAEYNLKAKKKFMNVYQNNTDTSLFSSEKELDDFVNMLLEDEKEEEDLNNEKDN